MEGYILAATQHERTNSRKCALQVLYQSAILQKSPEELIEGESLIDETRALDEYALSLLNGCADHVKDVDPYIIEASENWKIDRMPVIDRELLRMATYEMIYVEDVPISVSINEAVNLAKEYGGEDDSPRFVNGILGRIASVLEEERKNG